VADGAVRDDNSDDSCSLNHDRYNAERHHRAWSRILPAPGSLGVRVARWCLGGMVTGGLAVTVYSPPMTGNRPKLPGCHRGFETVNPVVAQ
jgi:hypothetical protein